MKRVATDIGGTFTDMVCFESNAKGEVNIHTAKTDTTPGSFETGILNAVSKGEVNLSEVDFFAHGTTIVINTLTEKKGVKTGLITTRGFRDVLEIARCNRPDLFNFNFKKQEPFVPRYLRKEVTERVNYKGEILTPLDESEVKELVKFFKSESVEAIAVCLLHGYRNTKHEEKILEIIKKEWQDVNTIASHHVTREWREYERTSTTVLSAYVLPIADKYLTNLEKKLKANGLKKEPYIMQSNGGITTLSDVKENPITLVESGPASGMLGGLALGNIIGKNNIIVLDIGGTTAKCTLIDQGNIQISTQYKIEHSKTQAGYPIQTPVIDLVEIGNGGGSIAWVDEGDKMHVGPQSAGAMPGPASYGRGGENLTTTDANILLGRIHPKYFMGGSQEPDIKSLEKASNKIKEKMHLGVDEIARGIIKIANANMTNALKLISVNKGYDPRDFSLVVIGGGGAMHGADLARELQIPEVIVPPYAGVFSALGMLMSDIRRDYIRTEVLELSSSNLPHIMEVFKQMQDIALNNYLKDGFSSKEVSYNFLADLRYSGQEHYVKVPLPNFNEKYSIEEIINYFHKAHLKKYTFELDTKVELVNFHLVSEVKVEKPTFPKIKETNQDADKALFDTKDVDFDEKGIVKTKFYIREKLGVDIEIEGPAVILENDTTTVVPPDFRLKVDMFGNLFLNTI